MHDYQPACLHREASASKRIEVEDFFSSRVEHGTFCRMALVLSSETDKRHFPINVAAFLDKTISYILDFHYNERNEVESVIKQIQQ